MPLLESVLSIKNFPPSASICTSVTPDTERLLRGYITEHFSPAGTLAAAYIKNIDNQPTSAAATARTSHHQPHPAPISACTIPH